MKIKVIKNHRIPPLLYKKNNYKPALYIAMFGLLGCLLFLGKLVYSGYSDNIEITQNDLIGLGAAMFTVVLFWPMVSILYVSSTLIGIIEAIVNDNNSEPLSNTLLYTNSLKPKKILLNTISITGKYFSFIIFSCRTLLHSQLFCF